MDITSIGAYPNRHDAVGHFAHLNRGWTRFKIQELAAGTHSEAVCAICLEKGDAVAIVKVWTDRKLALGELEGLRHLNGLGLKKMQLPQVWGIASALIGREERFLIGMTALPGKNVVELLHERDMAPITQACELVGEGLAELHESHRSEQSPDKTAVYALIDKRVKKMEQWIQAGKVELKVNLASLVEQLKAQVDQDSIHSCYQHGDATVENFLLAPQAASIAAVDCYHATLSLGPGKMPCGWAGHDVVKFRHGLRQRGIMAGLSLEQVQDAQAAFDRGYRATALTAAEQRLLNLNRTLYVLDLVIRELDEPHRPDWQRQRLALLMQAELAH